MILLETLTKFTVVQILFIRLDSLTPITKTIVMINVKINAPISKYDANIFAGL